MEAFNPDPKASEAIELSEQELAKIAGGADYVISGFMFEQDEFLQRKLDDSIVKQTNTSLTTFQLAFSDFDSFLDALNIFAGWFSRK